METTTMVILVGVAAFIGGIVMSLAGWSKQVPPVPWDGRSFLASAITALVGAVGIAEGFNYSGITNTALALAGAFGLGVAAVGAVSRVSGMIAARLYKAMKRLP